MAESTINQCSTKAEIPLVHPAVCRGWMNSTGIAEIFSATLALSIMTNRWNVAGIRYGVDRMVEWLWYSKVSILVIFFPETLDRCRFFRSSVVCRIQLVYITRWKSSVIQISHSSASRLYTDTRYSVRGRSIPPFAAIGQGSTAPPLRKCEYGACGEIR